MVDHGFDPDAIFERYGIDARLVGGPSNPVAIEPPLSSAGEQAQAELLHLIEKMQASLAMIGCSVRERPSDDATFDIFDNTLAKQLLEANDALRRLRERRDCKGAA